jgi:hypothetical protein
MSDRSFFWAPKQHLSAISGRGWKTAQESSKKIADEIGIVACASMHHEARLITALLRGGAEKDFSWSVEVLLSSLHIFHSLFVDELSYTREYFSSVVLVTRTISFLVPYNHQNQCHF